MERNLFSFLKSRLLGGGGERNPSENNKFTREEELQSSKSNFNSLNRNGNGGELYLDLNTIISNESHIGGGSKSFVNEDCATLCSNDKGKRAYAHFDKGGARHYLVSATSSDVKLNASDHSVGGGKNVTLLFNYGRREAA